LWGTFFFLLFFLLHHCVRLTDHCAQGLRGKLLDEHATFVPQKDFLIMSEQSRKIKTELFDKDGNPVFVITEQGADGKERIKDVVNAAGITLSGATALVTECVGGVFDVGIKGTGMLAKFFSKDGGFRSGGRDRVSQAKDMFQGKTDKEKIAAHEAAIEELKNQDK
jgi:hypothetical protein